MALTQAERNATQLDAAVQADGGGYATVEAYLDGEGGVWGEGGKGRLVQIINRVGGAGKPRPRGGRNAGPLPTPPELNNGQKRVIRELLMEGLAGVVGHPGAVLMNKLPSLVDKALEEIGPQLWPNPYAEAVVRAEFVRLINTIPPPPAHPPDHRDEDGDGSGKPIVIPEAEFIKEHKRLIKTLLSGKKADLTKEAKTQIKEVKQEVKARGGKAPWRYAHKAPGFFEYK